MLIEKEKLLGCQSVFNTLIYKVAEIVSLFSSKIWVGLTSKISRESEIIEHPDQMPWSSWGALEEPRTLWGDYTFHLAERWASVLPEELEIRQISCQYLPDAHNHFA